MAKIIFLFFLFLSLNSSAQTSKPESAENILKSAISNATYYNKNVMVVFHASWCGWCNRFIKAINSYEIKQILDGHFAIAYMDIREKGSLINTLENPGGKELAAKFGNGNSAVPFFAFLDSKGNLIASNTGYPASKSAIEIFVNMVEQSANKISKDKLVKISEFFTAVAPKD